MLGAHVKWAPPSVVSPLVDSGALGTPPPLRWGDEYEPYSSCQYCHSLL